jgi:glycosyltransferase involved in cell wall biosynthesis
VLPWGNPADGFRNHSIDSDVSERPATGEKPLTIALALESDGPGGAEWSLIHLATELANRGHRIVPIVPERGVGWLGAQLAERGHAARTFRLSHPLDLGCVRRLRRLFLDEHVSVLHAHEFTMTVFGTAAARAAGIPAIATLHSAQGFPDRLRRRVAIRWALRRASAVTTVSRATAAELSRRLGVPDAIWQVVPNGVPSPKGDRDATRAALGVSAGEKLLLAVGNLYPVKGHDILLKALAPLVGRAELPPWTAVVAGRGEELERLERLREDLGLGSRVHLLGYRDDVGALLRAADLFVHPSRSEGLPLAIIEAMTVGLPVVASRVGGLAEVVRDGETGLLVPPEDPTALSDALATLLRDAPFAARLGAEGRRVAEAEYGVDAMIDRYLRLYRTAESGR